MDLRVFAKKILSFFPRLYCHPNDYELIYQPRWIIKLCKAYKITKTILPFYPMTGFFYYHTRRLKKLMNGAKDLNAIYANYIPFFQLASDDVKFLVLQIFDVVGLVNDKTNKMALDFAGTTQNKAYRYWLTMDISKYTFMFQKGFYDDFYTDRKKVFFKICEDFKFNLKLTGVNNNSLCVVCYLLDKTNKNSAQRVAEMYANGLSSHFTSIDIVVLDTFSPSLSEKRGFTTLYSRKRSRTFKRNAKNQFNNNVNIHYPKGKHFYERLQYALDVIGHLNPRAIVDISDEYSPISCIYSQLIPTFYQPLRGYASSSLFNFVFGEKKRYELCNQRFNSFDTNKIVEFCFPEYVPPKSKEYSRRELGFLETDFVIVSIGNNQNAFNLKFVSAVIKILEKYPNIIWSFVGGKAPDEIHNRYEYLVQKKRIIERGYESNLSGYCSACDVVLRGNTTGGSGGTAIAAMQKLPIVMTDFLCDAIRWIGSDYSNIHTYDDVSKEIEKLYLDHDYYLERSSASYNRVTKAIDSEEKWKELSEIIKSKAKES